MTEEIGAYTFDIRDEYQRKPIAEKLITLLESEIDISPMLITGYWGTGKTEFCHKLINLYGEQHSEVNIAYVDAFKTDHADEPVMTLLAAVLEMLPEGQKQSLIDKALPVMRFSAKTILKAGVSWLLRQGAEGVAKDLEGEIKEASDVVINHSVENILKDHVEANKSIEALQIALGELAEINKIVVFVDELDRCRPDYAVSMLESIKHIFNVKGVRFVLVVNESQLRASINHCYGSAIEAQRYLDKFLKFKTEIPDTFPRSPAERMNVSIEHFSNCCRNNPKLLFLARSNEGLFGFVASLIEENKLSLREVETFVRYSEIYHALTGERSVEGKVYGVQLPMIFAIYMACFHPEITSGFNEVGPAIHEIVSILGVDTPASFSGRFPVPAQVIAMMLVQGSGVVIDEFQLTDEEEERWNEEIRLLFSGSFGIENIGNRLFSSVFSTLRLAS